MRKITVQMRRNTVPQQKNIFGANCIDKWYIQDARTVVDVAALVGLVYGDMRH